MKYDEILEEIGDYGPYQRKSYFLLCTPALMKAAIVMSAVFVLSLPEFRCAIPGISNDTFKAKDEGHRDLINTSIPLAPSDQGSGTYSHCTVYSNQSYPSQNWRNFSTGLNATNDDRDVTPCHSWVYDTKEVDSSIMTEFDFVCDNKAMRSHTNMGFFCGSLVGSFLIGTTADIIGRKKALLLCIALQFATGTSLYFLPSMISVVVIRSIQGMAGEMFAISTSTGMELVGPKKRTFAGMVVEFFWSGGQLLVLVVAYVAKDWRLVELVFGIAAIPLFITVCFTPESPRWLLDKQRFNEAEIILEKIASSNKKILPVDALTRCAEAIPDQHKVRVWKLFNNKTTLTRSLIVFFNWFAVNFLYYGLSLNLDNLSGSLYINFLISLCVETTGFIISIFLLDRTGRKVLHTVCMFVGGIACIAVIFPVTFGNDDYQWLITTLAMIGKMAASSCYSILYIWTVELFPTVVRNSALGVCSIFENAAGMTSPYIADLGILIGGAMSSALPTTVFGAVSVMAAILSLFLPETLNRPLPETIEDAISLKDRRQKSTSKVYQVNSVL